MAKKPSKAEIDAQIKWLEENKQFIQQYSGFGDNNWEKIDAEIETLKEGLSEDDIYDKSCEDGEDPDELGVEWSNAQRMSALDACQWMNGEEPDSPEDNWKLLVKKNK